MARSPPIKSRIQVDLSKLTSDESRRDNFIKGDTLQTNRYPNATFVPKQAEGLSTPLPTDGEVPFSSCTATSPVRPASRDR